MSLNHRSIVLDFDTGIKKETTNRVTNGSQSAHENRTVFLYRTAGPEPSETSRPMEHIFDRSLVIVGLDLPVASRASALFMEPFVAMHSMICRTDVDSSALNRLIIDSSMPSRSFLISRRYFSFGLQSTITPSSEISYSGMGVEYSESQAVLILSNPRPHASIIPLMKNTCASFGLNGFEECLANRFSVVRRFTGISPSFQIYI